MKVLFVQKLPYVFACGSFKCVAILSVVVESLQKLSTSTDILSEPSKLPEQAIQAVQQQTSSNVEH